MLDSFGHLVWWIASNQDVKLRAYSIIPQKAFIPYYDGMDKNLHVLPEKMKSSLQTRKPFNLQQIEEAGALTMLKTLAEQPPEKRTHPYLKLAAETAKAKSGKRASPGDSKRAASKKKRTRTL